jgi:hypothetical protein
VDIVKKMAKQWLIINVSVILILLVILFVMFQTDIFKGEDSHAVNLPVDSPLPTSTTLETPHIKSPAPVKTPVASIKPTTVAQPTVTATPAATMMPSNQPVSNTSKNKYGHINPDVIPVFNGDNAYPEAVRVKQFPNGDSIRYWIFKDDRVIDGQYSPKEIISFGNPSDYTLVERITTFRGSNYRNSAAYGERTVREKKLEVIWTKDIGQIDTWPGVGWTGQPMLVHWAKDVRAVMNLKPQMKDKDFVEVIYPTLDENIYFLDLETGKPTRDSIHIGFPTKGTAMVDPRGYPFLFTGQGINRNG